jgi:hypothetical protein
MHIIHKDVDKIQSADSKKKCELSFSVVWGNNRGLLYESHKTHKTHKYKVWTKCSFIIQHVVQCVHIFLRPFTTKFSF